MWPRKKKSTAEASMLKEALERRGLRVRSELWDKHKHIDLTIPSAKINVEIDGNQHLTSYKQILSDLDRSHYSALRGYDTIHIHNTEIQGELEEIADALATAAKIRKRRYPVKEYFRKRFSKARSNPPYSPQ